MLLGSTCAKAAHRTLMKLTPDELLNAVINNILTLLLVLLIYSVQQTFTYQLSYKNSYFYENIESCTLFKQLSSIQTK